MNDTIMFPFDNNNNNNNNIIIIEFDQIPIVHTCLLIENVNTIDEYDIVSRIASIIFLSIK